MIYEDKTKDQLINELMEARRRIREIIHDFNNSLTVIMGNIGVARIHTNNDNIHKALAAAEEASKQLRDLVIQLAIFAEK